MLGLPAVTARLIRIVNLSHFSPRGAGTRPRHLHSRLSTRLPSTLDSSCLRRMTVPYSVVTPQNGSPIWKVLNRRGDLVYSGSHQQCEEWLDLMDMRAASLRLPPQEPVDRVTTPLPIFELACALLRRFWKETAGEVRVSGESTGIFLMMVVMVCTASHFVWPVLGQPSSLIREASAEGFASHAHSACCETHQAEFCPSSHRLDMACDAVDE